jgi:hypothetical protein
MSSETITCRPEELGGVLKADLARHIEIQRQMLETGVGYMAERAAAEAPRDKGDFAASIRPYAGTPGRTWKRGGGGGTSGRAEAAAVARAWRPGEEIGIASDAPYGRKLFFHAGRYTKKVARGWLDRIVKAANKLATEVK